MKDYSEMLPEPYPVLQKNSATYDEEKNLLSEKRIGAEMSEETKNCPFCGQQPKKIKWREFGKKTREYYLYHCSNEECPSHFTKPGSMTAEDWNARPIEDNLRTERDQARSIIRELIKLGQNMRFRLVVYDDTDPTEAEWSDFLFKLRNDEA